ncbi:MAG: universal stress protein [Dehalococcoidales bacterium]|nr:universal stress protein [Dehalococcoidales bacterium]
MFKRILVPLDGSRFASKAIRYAEEIAQKFDSEVILLQVINPSTPFPTETNMAGAVTPSSTKVAIQIAYEENQRNEKRAKNYLTRKAREISKNNIKVAYQVMIGVVSEAIIHYAKKEKFDLVIMTTHGKGGLKRAILGSITDEVIRKSGNPVLTIRK